MRDTLLSSEDRIQLDNQLQVFEAVMNKDVAEVQSTYRGDIINLSDPEALFSTILTGSIEDDCFGTFLSILQHLVAIPSTGKFNRNVCAMCLALQHSSLKNWMLKSKLWWSIVAHVFFS